jgi:hypothetical protein
MTHTSTWQAKTQTCTTHPQTKDTLTNSSYFCPQHSALTSIGFDESQHEPPQFDDWPHGWQKSSIVINFNTRKMKEVIHQATMKLTILTKFKSLQQMEFMGNIHTHADIFGFHPHAC